ncbi:hypothetical protein SAY86_008431 [Trapa natans]|uniref:SLC26A/SulP transporter domain-containing protein n=1 Tax=Trapa natans TaxID=22666 RepID=A0AAN7QAY1_TRANT|nr:hypothetical protein SAY86_008431 [Trapa natans]
MEPRADDESYKDGNRVSVHHHHFMGAEMEITAPEVHMVVEPPPRTTFQKLKCRLKETFFPDDPLRQFKGQPCGRKFLLAAQYIFPVLQWGPHYKLGLFKSDIVSGLTIASLAIPQGISYAKLANLRPIVGLLSIFFVGVCSSLTRYVSVLIVSSYLCMAMS